MVDFLGRNVIVNFQNVERMNIGSLSDKELSHAIINYKTHIKQLNEQVDDAKDLYNSLEQELLKRYEEEGQTSTTFIDPDGRKRTLYVTKKLNPISKFAYGDEFAGQLFFDVLGNHGLDHLTQRTPGEAMRSARAIFKEMYETEGNLPEDIAQFVEMQETSAVSMRTA
jgi:hypothetical protein